MLQSRNILSGFHLSYHNTRYPKLCCTFSELPISGVQYICPTSRPFASSSSSTRWKSRQVKDPYKREARVQGLRSRAAFKLLEIDAKHKIFQKGQTVVDLGYAPGSWSQVAVERTRPNGRIVAIDLIPALPPKGVSTIQGDFLSSQVQSEVKRFLQDPDRGRPRPQTISVSRHSYGDESKIVATKESTDLLERRTGQGLISQLGNKSMISTQMVQDRSTRMVDVVLSDMSAPFEQTTGFRKRTLSDPYHRLMNVTGIKFLDHAGSMDLCAAALQFSRDTLRTGGHFVCKFYQGAEDKDLEGQLRKTFSAVYREKPDSSHNESKEAYFVALRRKSSIENVFYSKDRTWQLP